MKTASLMFSSIGNAAVSMQSDDFLVDDLLSDGAYSLPERDTTRSCSFMLMMTRWEDLRWV